MACREPEAEPDRSELNNTNVVETSSSFAKRSFTKALSGFFTPTLRSGDASQSNPTASAGSAAPDAFRASLLQSLVSEPYETMFADPPDGTCRIRNADTGSVRVVDESGKQLTKSFLCGSLADPSALQLSDGRKPWTSWWAQRETAEKDLREGAALGDTDKVMQVIRSRQDGSVPMRIDAVGCDGWAPLHHACAAGHEEIVKALLDADAVVDLRGVGNATPLHEASRRGHGECVRILMQSRADPLSVCCGQLPIHLAAMSGHDVVVTTLIELGGKQQLSERNFSGALPVEVASNVQTQQAFDAVGEVSADTFSRRKPLGPKCPLLPNSRADFVQRLLLKTKQPSCRLLEDEEASATTMSGSRSPSGFSTLGSRTPRTGINSPRSSPQSTPRMHPPFVKVKEAAQIEPVGPASFEVLKVLGRGSFGEVYKVQHKTSGEVYAMKVLQKAKVRSKNLQRYAMSERNILSFIRHPYIVTMHYAFQTSSYLVMVLEFCSKGNLQDLIQRERRLSDPLAQLYTAEVLLALLYLHERRIIFRDLKPENVARDAEQHVKLIDFGLSKEGVGINGTKTFCGSVAYLAPEILLGQEHNHTVDIYDLGVMLFAMLTGMPPFYNRDRDTLFMNIKFGRLNVPRYVSPSATAFIQETMYRDPKNRIGASNTAECKEHAYFEGLDFDKLMLREVPVPSEDCVLASRGSTDTQRSRRASRSDPFEREGAFNDAGPSPMPYWDFSSPTRGRASP